MENHAVEGSSTNKHIQRLRFQTLKILKKKKQLQKEYHKQNKTKYLQSKYLPEFIIKENKDVLNK